MTGASTTSLSQIVLPRGRPVQQLRSRTASAAAPLLGSFLMWWGAARGMPHPNRRSVSHWHRGAGRLVPRRRRPCKCPRARQGRAGPGRAGHVPPRSRRLPSAGLQREDRPVQPEPQRLERLPQPGLRLHPHAGGQRHPPVLGAGL